MVELANREVCGLFVVAGDLFHNHNVSKEDILRTVEILGSFEGDCMAILPGNHDFYHHTSQLWKTFTDYAGKQVLLLREEKPYALSDYGLNVVLYPAPCDRKHCAENRLGWIARLELRPAGRWQLGVAHGTVFGLSPDIDKRYFPMEREELLGLGLDLWFLGHLHLPYPEQEPGQNIGFSFCGTPEPDGFDCSHAGAVCVAELEGEIVKSRRFWTGAHSFLDRKLEIRCLEELEKFVAKVGGEKVLMKLAVCGLLSHDRLILSA